MKARKDGNHNAIADTFRALGCSVKETHMVGEFIDMVVGCVGMNHLVEVKNLETQYGRAGFSATQSKFSAAWRGEKPHKVECPADAIKLVQRWRKEAQVA